MTLVQKWSNFDKYMYIRRVDTRRLSLPSSLLFSFHFPENVVFEKETRRKGGEQHEHHARPADRLCRETLGR